MSVVISLRLHCRTLCQGVGGPLPDAVVCCTRHSGGIVLLVARSHRLTVARMPPTSAGDEGFKGQRRSGVANVGIKKCSPPVSSSTETGTARCEKTPSRKWIGRCEPHGPSSLRAFIANRCSQPTNADTCRDIVSPRVPVFHHAPIDERPSLRPAENFTPCSMRRKVPVQATVSLRDGHFIVDTNTWVDGEAY